MCCPDRLFRDQLRRDANVRQNPSHLSLIGPLSIILDISQPSVRTVEGVLFEAFVKSGAVSEENSDDPVKVSLARAARTDAGVHAAGNVMNMKLITSPPGVNDLVAVVNNNLPPDIRVWDIARIFPIYHP